MDKRHINRLILAYLKKKEYGSAYEHFAKEARLSHSDASKMTLEAHLGLESTVAAQLMFFGSDENRPSAYLEGYATLRDWVQASLEIYREELHRVLFPVFVYSFLEMCERGYWAQAREFVDEHWSAHEVHMEGVQALIGISTREHLRENPLAARLRSHRLWLRMSKASLDFLLSFLQSKGLILILSILNCRVHIDTTIAPGDAKVGPFFHDMLQLQGSTNKHHVHWELVGKEPYYPRSLQQIKELNRAESEDDEEEEAEAGESRRKNTPRLDTRYLPRLDEQVDEDIMNELKHQVHISPSKLPSVCFHTFVNAAQGLNCVYLSRDATSILSGHADSTVKLYRHVEKKRPDIPPDQQDEFKGVKFPNVAAGKLHSLVGHSGSVFGVCLDPENDFALSCSEDGTARLWSLEALRCLSVFKGHNHPVWDVAFAPLGSYFATASHDSTARLWRTDHALPLRIFAGHVSDVDCVQFHPNCNYVATGSSDKSVRLWDFQQHASVRLFLGHSAPVSALCFSPNGRVLASGSTDGEVLLWDLAAATCVQALSRKDMGAVHALDFSANSEMLAVGHHNDAVCLWGLDGLRSKFQSRMEKEDQHSKRRSKKGDDKAKQADAGEARLLHTAHTRHTPVFNVTFTHRNLLLASGPFVHPSPLKRRRLW